MQNTPDMSTILKLAQSSAGKQLLSLLQSVKGSELNEAMAKASAGDYRGAREVLSSVLEHPQAQSLLKEMEELK